MADDVKGAILGTKDKKKQIARLKEMRDLLRQAIGETSSIGGQDYLNEYQTRLQAINETLFALENPDVASAQHRLAGGGMGIAAGTTGALAPALLGQAGMTNAISGTPQGAAAEKALGKVKGALGKLKLFDKNAGAIERVLSPSGIAAGVGAYALSGAAEPLREGIKDKVGELTGRNEKLREKEAAMKDLDQQNAMELAETNVRGNTAAEKIKLSQRQAELDADVTKQAIAQQNIMPNMVADINRYTAQGISYLPSVPVDIYAAIGVSPLNIQQMQQSASVAGQQANSP